MVLPSLFHEVGKKADVAGALDSLGQLALLLRGNRGDPRRDDLAALGDEPLEQADVLVIDPGRILAGKGAGLAAAEKCSCHDYSPSSSRPRPGRPSPRPSRSPRPSPRPSP